MAAHDLAVMIGQFQPFHEGQVKAARAALVQADRLMFLVGSHREPRWYRNPFTFEERKEMILGSMVKDWIDGSRIICVPLEDIRYNDELWMAEVRKHVHCYSSKRIALISEPSSNSKYGMMFPEWDMFTVPNYLTVSASHIRSAYFSNIGHMWLTNPDGHRDGDTPRDRLVSSEVRAFLTKFIDTPEYAAIRAECEFIREYNAPFTGLPFPPTFVTADACVIQSGHVLLVKRKNPPFKGYWALPGGYVKPHQTVEEAMLAELGEETLIDRDIETIRRSIIYQRVYDAPYRDPRGRVITHASLVHLTRSRFLPLVEGADDAADAKWFPLNEVQREMMGFDHYDMTMNLVNRV